MSQIRRVKRAARRVTGSSRASAPAASSSKQGPNKGWSATALTRYGFSPATLVDVGASNGTVAFYDAFPEASLLLIEPRDEQQRRLKKLLRGRKGEYVLAAAGAKPGRTTLHVESSRRGMSSMLLRTDEFSTGDPIEDRDVPVTTLDLMAERAGIKPPFGLKVDTEGYELEVIRGAHEFLRSTQFVVAEVSVARRFHDGYTFAEFIAAMDAEGFGVTRVLSGGGSYADLLFTPYSDEHTT